MYNIFSSDKELFTNNDDYGINTINNIICYYLQINFLKGYLYFIHSPKKKSFFLNKVTLLCLMQKQNVVK